jgi:hypothetical protein
LICQDEGFPVFAQGLSPILANGVDRHGEKSKLHVSLLWDEMTDWA